MRISEQIADTNEGNSMRAHDARVFFSVWTDLFCIHSGFISANWMANASRVNSFGICLCLASSSMATLFTDMPFAPIANWRFPIRLNDADADAAGAVADGASTTLALFVAPMVSSPTAQSTNGSYTNASNNVNNVSRPFFNVFKTCSHARRNVPWNDKNKIVKIYYYYLFVGKVYKYWDMCRVCVCVLAPD